MPACFATSAIAIAVWSSPSVVCVPSVSTSITLRTCSRDGPFIPCAPLQRPPSSHVRPSGRRAQQPHDTSPHMSYSSRKSRMSTAGSSTTHAL